MFNPYPKKENVMKTTAPTPAPLKIFDWISVRKLGKFDIANRFTATHPAAIEYITQNGYRQPSRTWPFSHAKPLFN